MYKRQTLSWPVAGTMMVEPTESETLRELERFGEAMNMIRYEDPEIVKNSPYTAKELAGEWKHKFSRLEAAYPVEQEYKFWSSVSRIDNVYGDRNLVCSCS